MKNFRADRPLLSIIIVTYNAEMSLPITLKSLLGQPQIFTDVEVVLVDGLSTDCTLSIARGYEFIDTVVSEPDLGIYDAMNKGVRLARGQWVQFLNAGDALTDSQSLRRLLSAAESAYKLATPWAVVGAQNMGGASGEIRRIRNVPHNWWKHAYGLQSHCHQACIFERDTLLRAGIHSLDFGTAGDFDLILRFGLLNRPFEVGEVCINYAGGGVSEISASRNPGLQHAIRTSRFQLGNFGVIVDAGTGRAVASVNRLRKLGGKARRLLHRR